MYIWYLEERLLKINIKQLHDVYNIMYLDIFNL